MAPVNAEPQNTHVLLLLSPASCSQASVPPVHTRRTWYSIVWTRRRIRTGAPVCIPKPIQPLVTPVICAALHPVRRASCTSKILLSMYWTFFHSGAPRGFVKNSSNCAVAVHGPIPSLGPLSLSPRLQSRDRKPQVHDSTAPAISLLEAALHFANTSKPLGNRRSLTSSRASSSKSGLLKHVMSELTLFLMCSRLAAPQTANASPARSWAGFLRAWSKIGPFERSSSRCGQLMFWSRAHVEK